MKMYLRDKDKRIPVNIYHQGKNKDLLVIKEETGEEIIVEEPSFLIGSSDGMIVSGSVKKTLGRL